MRKTIPESADKGLFTLVSIGIEVHISRHPTELELDCRVEHLRTNPIRYWLDNIFWKLRLNRNKTRYVNMWKTHSHTLSRALFLFPPRHSDPPPPTCLMFVRKWAVYNHGASKSKTLVWARHTRVHMYIADLHCRFKVWRIHDDCNVRVCSAICFTPKKNTLFASCLLSRRYTFDVCAYSKCSHLCVEYM
jgi:hypothetical protein